MSKLLTRKLEISQKDDKFIVCGIIEEELSAEEAVKRLEVANTNLEAIQKDIDAIPEIVKSRSSQLEEQKKMLTEDHDLYVKVEQKARLIFEKNKKQEERK